MAHALSAYWAKASEQLAADTQAYPKPPATVIPLTAVPDGAAQAGPAPGKRSISDWTNVLDAIGAAEAFTRHQEKSFHDQATHHKKEVEQLRQELKQAGQQLQAADAYTRDLQAQFEARLRESEAQIEARVQDLQARAEMRIQVAEERARASEARAEEAESWLLRIESAAKSLVSNDRLGSALKRAEEPRRFAGKV